MWHCGENLKTRLFGFYNHALGYNLKKKFENKIDYLHHHSQSQNGIDVKAAYMKVKTLIEFDNLITAPLFGYGDIDNYYDKASCCHRLPGI